MAHDGAMSAILYPVAANAEAALARPLGRVARRSDAAALASAEVTFVSEDVGPDYPNREAALDSLGGRLDDERPGHARQVAPEDRFCQLVERLAEGSAMAAPLEPAFAAGRRWPAPLRRTPTRVFRLQVSYWRVGAGGAKSGPQARQVRRSAEAARLDAAQLRALAQQPLKPVKPQQPLDVGLFEAPAPEAPHILIPDE
jgi:hypothetical protein